MSHCQGPPSSSRMSVVTPGEVDSLVSKCRWITCENCDKFITFQPKASPPTKGYCSITCIQAMKDKNNKCLTIVDTVADPSDSQSKSHQPNIGDIGNVNLEPKRNVQMLPARINQNMKDKKCLSIINTTADLPHSQSKSHEPNIISGIGNVNLEPKRNVQMLHVGIKKEGITDFEIAQRPVKKLDFSDSELDYSKFVAPLPVPASTKVNNTMITSMGFPPAGSTEGKLGYGQPGARLVTQPPKSSFVDSVPVPRAQTRRNRKSKNK